MPNSFIKGGKGNSTNTRGMTTTSYKVRCGDYMSLNTIISEAIHVENMQRACTSTQENVYTSIVFPQNFLMKFTVHLSVLYIYTSYIPRESLTVGELILAVLKSLRNSDMLIFPSLSISASSRSGSMEPLKPVCCKRILSCK